jgi:hypothetical protein
MESFARFQKIALLVGIGLLAANNEAFAQVCQANSQQTCTTQYGSGSQTCNSSGTAWGPCQIPILTMPLTTLDTAPTGTINGANYFAYGTFQSNDQKTIQNQNGIFTTYVKSYQNEGGSGANDVSTWVIKQSKDGGVTWAPIWTYTSSNGSKAPCMETDSSGNVYLAFPTNHLADAYFSELLASEKYSPPHSILISGAGAGKYSCAFSPNNNEFDLLGWSTLARINTATNALIDQKQMFVPGSTGSAEYPVIAYAADAPQYLAGAWTTVSSQPVNYGNGGGYPYMDIRFGMSWDYGATWGTPWVGNNWSLPIYPDNTGPAPQALVQSDYNALFPLPQLNVQNWLDSFVFVDGYFFFMYSHIDTSANWTTRLTRLGEYSPSLQITDMSLAGETITLVTDGGSLVTQAIPGGGHYLYAIGQTTSSQVGVLISKDYGQTWHDWSLTSTTAQPYAVVASKTVTSDGFIIGEYTDFAGSTQTNSAKIQFFRVPADFSQCLITLTACPKYPSYKGTFSDNYQNAGSNQARCMQRATDYYGWCGDNSSQPVTAKYLFEGTVVQSTTTQ